MHRNSRDNRKPERWRFLRFLIALKIELFKNSHKITEKVTQMLTHIEADIFRKYNIKIKRHMRKAK